MKTSQLGVSFVNTQNRNKNTDSRGGSSGNTKGLYSGGVHFKSLLDTLRILYDFPQSMQSNARTAPPSVHDHLLPSSLKFIIHLSTSNELCVM